VNAQHRFWPARLRWRLRGATMWPAFAAITLLNGWLLHELPPIGTGVDLIPGILLATFGNLVLVGVLAPWLARRTLARRPPAPDGAPPRAQLELLTDRIGTGLLLASVVGVIAAGLAAEPTVVSETKATQENAEAVRAFVLHTGDAELLRNLETANTIRLKEGYFRTCVARDDRRHYYCVFVDTKREPAKLVLDRSAEPNSVYQVP
jgi:hypothetical protein